MKILRSERKAFEDLAAQVQNATAHHGEQMSVVSQNSFEALEDLQRTAHVLRTVAGVLALVAVGAFAVYAISTVVD